MKNIIAAIVALVGIGYGAAAAQDFAPQDYTWNEATQRFESPSTPQRGIESPGGDGAGAGAGAGSGGSGSSGGGNGSCR